MKYPNSRHAIFRLTAASVRHSIWLDTLPKVRDLCFPGLLWTQHSMDGYVELPNGSTIFGLDDKDRVEKVLGMEFATIPPGNSHRRWQSEWMS
jgi:hypothetical protein